MFFGKYLVENGVITPEQLVDAIAVQMESLPSVISVVRDKKMLSCNEIIELVDKSIDERKNIMELIVEKSIFAQYEIDELLEGRYKSGRGLCEILFKQGHASSIIVSEYVKKYLKEQNKITSKEEKKDDFEGILNFDIGGEFIKIFDMELFEFINGEIERIKNKDREKHIFNIRKELALLVTLASMGNFEYTIDLFQIWLEVLDKSKGTADKCHWNEVASGLKHAMRVSWSLREEVVKKGWEKSLLEDGKWKRKYYEGIRRAEYLLQEYPNKKSA